MNERAMRRDADGLFAEDALAPDAQCGAAATFNKGIGA